MNRVFDNNSNLPKYVIFYRLLDADPSIEVRLYDAHSPDLVSVHHYAEVDSTLTDAQITAALADAANEAEMAAYALYVGARTEMRNIPGWATWTAAQAQDWGNTNIGTPLSTARASLPASLTLATTRTAFVWLLNILDQMWTLQQALGRAVIALRNKTF